MSSQASKLAELLDSGGDVKLEHLDNVSESEASSSAKGLMSSADKSKLDNISTSANNYVHPTGAGNKHVPTGGSTGQLLTNTASGTGTWQDAPVSLPSQTGNSGKYLTTDGTDPSWVGLTIYMDGGFANSVFTSSEINYDGGNA